ncbi:MAG: phosphoribosylaminoimidazolesuccinocarboxamide synthase [Acidobacteriota bacterium]
MLVMNTLDLPGIKKVHSGKVREMFEVDGDLLMVATDRVSAFDVVLPDTVPAKGKILTQLSSFWFDRTSHLVKNHLLSRDVKDFPRQLKPFAEQLAGRSLLVRKCRPLPVECVVRGFLAGSGWSEYQEHHTICGIRLPPGLRQSDPLPEALFTPSTKSTKGHDENIRFEELVGIVGRELAEDIRGLSLQVYDWAREFARHHGIIIADTKFEFGQEGSDLYLIDELLTPDSSRFWPTQRYQPGKAQSSYDKQFIRDYLNGLAWNKQAPAPKLPDSILESTSQRYRKAFRCLTGREPDL